MHTVRHTDTVSHCCGHPGCEKLASWKKIPAFRRNLAASFFGFIVVRTRTWHGYRRRVMNGLGLGGGEGGEENFQSQWKFFTMRLYLSSVLFVSCTRSWLRIFLVTLRIKLRLVFTLINFTLKMEAGFSSETLKSASRTTLLINPEVYSLTPNRADNTKNLITLPLESASRDVSVTGCNFTINFHTFNTFLILPPFVFVYSESPNGLFHHDH